MTLYIYVYVELGLIKKLKFVTACSGITMWPFCFSVVIFLIESFVWIKLNPKNKNEFLNK